MSSSSRHLSSNWFHEPTPKGRSVCAPAFCAWLVPVRDSGPRITNRNSRFVIQTRESRISTTTRQRLMITPQRHKAHQGQTGRFGISVSFVPLWCMKRLVVVLDFGAEQRPDAVTGIVVADTFPATAVGTVWTWTCVRTGGAVCGNAQRPRNAGAQKERGHVTLRSCLKRGILPTAAPSAGSSQGRSSLRWWRAAPRISDISGGTRQPRRSWASPSYQPGYAAFSR